jgi:hypothetical protein
LVQIILRYREFKIIQIKGQVLFKGEIITKIQKIGWCHLKIFFSRTTGPILTRLGTKHPLAKGIQNCTMKDNPFPQGEIIAKE